MIVVDLEEYKARKKEAAARQEMKKLIQKLDNIADYVYENYDPTRYQGYERFKRLLKTLDEKYDKKD